MDANAPNTHSPQMGEISLGKTGMCMQYVLPKCASLALWGEKVPKIIPMDVNSRCHLINIENTISTKIIAPLCNFSFFIRSHHTLATNVASF